MKDQQKKQPKNPDVHDPSKILHKTPRKASVENPDKTDGYENKTICQREKDLTRIK
jgi:hypothetical protein